MLDSIIMHAGLRRDLDEFTRGPAAPPGQAESAVAHARAVIALARGIVK